jgi:hypothetical protein
MRDVFLILNTEGQVVGKRDTAKAAIDEAAREAKRDGGGVYATMEQLQGETPLQHNPPLDAMRAYDLSKLEERLKETGAVQLRRPDGGTYWAGTKESVMALSLEEAWRKLRPYFPAGTMQERQVRGAEKGVRALVELGGKVWDEPASAAANFFKFNTKMEKNATELFKKALGKNINADSHGLSLLPHYIAFRGGIKETPKGSKLEVLNWTKAKILEHYSPNPEGVRGTWCCGSSPGCRATCLSFSGQNQVADEAILYKHAMSAALRAEPMAFLRLMVEGLRKEMNYKGGKGVERWVRLNVYQDLPWEVIFPDLFARSGDDKTSSKVGGWVPKLRAYDYTKTPGREFLDNYNLTFSYSGVNMEDCRKQLAAGRNVAVVVILPSMEGKPMQGRTAETMPLRYRYAVDPDKVKGLKTVEALSKFFYPIDLSAEFGKVPVLNGDVHDIRAYDHEVLQAAGWDGSAIVGLDYKIPMVKTQGGEQEELASLDKAGRFVLRVHETKSGIMLPVGGVAAYMLTKIA